MISLATGLLGQRLVAHAPPRRAVTEMAGFVPLPPRLDLAPGYFAKTFLPPTLNTELCNITSPETETRGGIRPYKLGLDSVTQRMANSSWE